jgi:hypothetical protein
MTRKYFGGTVLALFALGCGSGSVQGEVHTPPPPQANVTVTAGTQPVAQQGTVVQQQGIPVQQQQVVAQTVVVQQGGVASNFGQVTLHPGFTPDPHIVEGRSGGGEAAAARDRRCRGYITGMPDHLVRLEGNFNYLRIMAAAADDVTLVVQTPSGTYLCDDDSEGRNPIVEGRFVGGQYLVWVGSYTAGVNSAYRLGFSELRRVRPSSLGYATGNVGVTTVPVGVNSNFGTMALAPGFTPDPAVSRGVSGGAVNANAIGGACRGFISQTPDHILVANGNFPMLRLLVRSNQDTTLVVQDQGGRVWCDDDSGGSSNPLLQSSVPAGTYRIWVGSYRAGVQAPYTIGFSELSSVSPFSLPSP